MTITFKNNNEVIIYALEKIFAFARENQYIIVAQCVWWLASIIGLESGLATHIDNLRKRSEVYSAPGVAHTNPGIVHPDRLFQIEKATSDQKDQSCRESSELESEHSITSEDNLHNQILNNCEEFL